MSKNNVIRFERAKASHDQLTPEVIGLIKGMLKRGDKQSDIAAFFLINVGRVSETNTDHPRGEGIPEAPPSELPPPGPYVSPYTIWRVCKAGSALEKAFKAIGAMIR